MKRIAVVVGTRPEIIKLAPVVRELGDQGYLIHSGQHLDPSMSSRIFEESGIGTPDLTIDNVGGRRRASQISTGLAVLSDLFESASFGSVIVQGDTNTVSAAAQAGNYAGIPVVHVEAGLRSHDRMMPEEINRTVAGVLADAHCAPTRTAAANLLAEGVKPGHIFVTGNTVVEATLASLDRPKPPLPIPLSECRHSVLATIHRAENTDSPDALERVLLGLASVDAPVILILHPRTRAAIGRHRLWPLTAALHLIEPVTHQQLLMMMSNARLVVSDSGGLQEECTIVKTPMIVVRRSTERPESVAAGFSRLVAPGDEVATVANRLLSNPPNLARTPTPFGDGLASRRIAMVGRSLARGSSPGPFSVVGTNAFDFDDSGGLLIPSAAEETWHV